MKKSKIDIFFLIFLIIIPLTFLSINTSFSNNSRIDRLPKHPVSAKWTANGKAICTEFKKQENIDVFSNGAKGAVIVWEDNRTGDRDIYGLGIWSNGTLYGDNDGTVVCNALNDQINPKGVANITSGSIIVWADNRTGELDIYAQLFDTSGIMVWGDNGTSVCNATGDQLDPQICGDGLGGAIITWEDNRTDELDIYAQRIDPDGNLLWGNNGTAICNATNEQKNPQIISDNSTGAIVTWQDKRNSAFEDIYALRINKSGNKVAGWLDNGTIICNALYEQRDPQLCLYNSGGAFITWGDQRYLGISGRDIYAQIVDPDGKILGKDNGTVVSNATLKQEEHYIIPSGLNSAIISWQDWRNFLITGFTEIYAQKIDLNGETLWDDNGTVICNDDNFQWYPRICRDGEGGAVITWEDWRNPISGFDIYAQRINSDGVTLWRNNGKVVCDSSLQQKNPELCSNGEGGAIIAWEDARNFANTDYDIYAQNTGYRGLIPGDDDNDDDDVIELDVFMVVAVISIVSAVAIVAIIVVLIKKGVINISKLKRKR